MNSNIKKRSRTTLEKDRTKVSPPSKMPRENSKEYTLNDVMNNIDEMKAELKGEFARVWKKLDEVDHLKKKVSELEKVKDSFQRFEVEEKKKSLLIKGLKSATEQRFETKDETKASLDELFSLISMTPNILDYHRMGAITQGKSEETLIRVKFASADDKTNLFRRFKEMGRNDRLSKISLINDYPFFQLDEVKKLSNIAYELRTKTKGTRTRIVPRGLGVALQRLEDGKWINVSPQRGGSEQ